MKPRSKFKLWGNNSNIFSLTSLFLVALFLTGQYFQLQTGYADNGDFRRVNQLFTDGPVGFSKEPPESDTLERTLRYNNYWLPEWNFRWAVPSFYSAFSSTILLWIPGAIINYLFISTSILYMVVLSIFPRLLAGFCIVYLIAHFSRDKRYGLLLIMCIVLPLILIMNTSDYAAYFNSFYQESGSLVYLIMFIAWFFIRHTLSNKYFLVIGYGLLFLLTTAKSSNFYFPFVFFLFLFDFQKALHEIKWTVFALALLFLPVVFTILFVGDRSDANVYNSIFFGVLLSSKDPEQRLADIGISDPDAMNCLTGFFDPVGVACYQKYRDNVSYYSLVKIIVHEPGILVRHAKRIGNQIHGTNINRGKYAVGDTIHRNENLLNAWVLFTQKYFPHEWAFWGVLFAETAVNSYLRKKGRHPLIRDLATLTLFLLLSCWLDMWVAILGDGIADLVKHLFLSNIMFGLSVFLTVATMCIALVESSLSISKSARVHGT